MEIILKRPLILQISFSADKIQLEAYEMLKPYIEYVHVKDARMADGEVVPAGTGDGQLSSHIFDKLGRSPATRAI